jgi:hypothetical protein
LKELDSIEIFKYITEIYIDQDEELYECEQWAGLSFEECRFHLAYIDDTYRLDFFADKKYIDITWDEVIEILKTIHIKYLSNSGLLWLDVP